ncbi:MAG TPA: glycosyltransferase family 2 protein [Streptosporangiaceae bacterium]|nr:glycosyltransferase family 2 protein [Streptosporangiaceae bacterium]
MIPWWGLTFAVLGVNFAMWGAVGLVRLAASLPARLHRRRETHAVAAGAMAMAVRGGATPAVGDSPAVLEAPPPTVLEAPPPTVLDAPPPSVREVAVLIPAHNEALVIEGSLRSIMTLVPQENVHVISDGSTDATVRIARAAGAKVIETRENIGKAGALAEAIQRFHLIERFEVVMLLDADTRVGRGYFAAGLPMFANPAVAAVAGCVRTSRDRKLSFTGNLVVGHRERIYAVGQHALKFGQTWLRANATPIVPGFASMYRSAVLPRMDMNPPGLVIEDFNMTFEVYQKDLGKVGFSLAAVAITQDPDNLHDYVRQTKRWALGLWQTVRRHPPRRNLFTAMLTLLLLELVTSSLLFFLLPLALLVLAVPEIAGSALSWPGFAEVHNAVAAHLRLSTIFFGVLVPDYVLTCAVAVLERRPRLLFFGLFFPLMRVIDALISLQAIPLAWLARSSGRWQSPSRRPVVPTRPPARGVMTALPSPGAGSAQRAGKGRYVSR